MQSITRNYALFEIIQMLAIVMWSYGDDKHETLLLHITICTRKFLLCKYKMEKVRNVKIIYFNRILFLSLL